MPTMVIQGIGFLGVISFILSYQVKSNKALYLYQLIGSLLFCLQFFLLGAGSGALSLFLNIIRSALLMKYKEWKWVRWKGLPLLLCLAFAGIMVYTWSGTVSVLAFFGLCREYGFLLDEQCKMDQNEQFVLRFARLAAV